MSMLTRVMKYNRLPFIINKNGEHDISGSKQTNKQTNEQKEELQTKPLRKEQEDTQQRFCTKRSTEQDKRLFKAQGTETIQLEPNEKKRDTKTTETNETS